MKNEVMAKRNSDARFRRAIYIGILLVVLIPWVFFEFPLNVPMNSFTNRLSIVSSQTGFPAQAISMLWYGLIFGLIDLLSVFILFKILRFDDTQGGRLIESKGVPKLVQWVVVSVVMCVISFLSLVQAPPDFVACRGCISQSKFGFVLYVSGVIFFLFLMGFCALLMVNGIISIARGEKNG